MPSDLALDNYRLLGRSGLRVSPLCLGCMTFGNEWGKMGNNYEESKKVFDLYRSNGGNFFDTANVYTGGSSEKYLGEYLSTFRSDAVIATKYTAHPDGKLSVQFGSSTERVFPRGGNSRKSLVESLDESLKRMGVGYIDLFYVHAWEYRTPVDEVMRSLDDVVRSGKALYVGISDTPAWVVSQANTIAHFSRWSPFIALQSRYNMLDRSLEAELGPMSREMGLGIVPWGILAEGFLTGKHSNNIQVATGRKESISKHSKDQKNKLILDEVIKISKEVSKTPAQVSINWLLHKGVTSPIVGARTVEQLSDNLEALGWDLSTEQMKRLDDVSATPYPFPNQSEWISRVGAYFTTGGTRVEFINPLTSTSRPSARF